MDTRVHGYIRVSSKAQNESRQRKALIEHGVSDRDIYVDKASGKNFERPEYLRMKSALKEGDKVVILDLDRLGRNYDQMAKEWQEITRDKKCDIEIINYPLLSTVREKGNLDTKFVADIIFSLLSYVAQREREDIKQRQREGIEAAKICGTKFGRPKVARPDNFDEIFKQVQEHKITNKKAMILMGLKPNTYYSFVNEIKNKREEI